ncbi:MAG: hypothetical protein K9H84_01340 [Bacteroidales bacterium]|nr:hypothetical protein [Bacteroidales bacterium]
MYKAFSIIAFSLFAFACSVSAQTQKETVELGDNMFALDNFEEAAKLYKRVAFFGDDSIQAYVYPKIAKSELMNGNYKESLFFYDVSLNTTNSDSAYNEHLYKIAFCHLLLDEPQKALIKVFSARNQDSSDYFMDKYNFYMGVIHVKIKKYDDAKEYFLNAARGHEYYDDVSKVLNSVKFNRPSPKLAKILSIVIPGLGQLYAGDAFNAANSFLLNSGLAASFLYIAKRHTFFNAFTSIGPWFQRYYTGGFNRAEKIAMERQNEKRDKVLIQIFSLMMKEKNGNFANQ